MKFSSINNLGHKGLRLACQENSDLPRKKITALSTFTAMFIQLEEACSFRLNLLKHPLVHEESDSVLSDLIRTFDFISGH